MDQPQINEDGRVLGRYQDFDKHLADFVTEYKNMPLEVHHFNDDDAKDFMVKAGYKGVAIVSDEDQLAKLEQAVAQATPEELARAKLPDGDKDLIESPSQGQSASPNQETGQATGQEAGVAAAPASKAARKPSSIESALASIQMSPVRQDRFVITGDPVVQQVFYDKLARDGKLFYRGGQPVIAASEKDTIKYLNEASRAVHKTDALHAASMSFDRQGSGIVGSIKAGLLNRMGHALQNVSEKAGDGVLGAAAKEVLNRLGRFDRTNVFVVGDEAARSEKLKELGGLLTEMDKRGFIKPENVKSGDTPGFQLKADGELIVPKSGPVTLVRGEDIYDMIQIAKETSIRYNTAEGEKNLARKEFKNRQEDEKIRSSGEAVKGAGAGDASAAAETTKLVPPHERTVGFAKEMDALFASPTALQLKNEKKQPEAVGILYLARGFKDPVKPELATLPTEQRQTFVTQLAVAMAKAETGEFEKVNLDAKKDGVGASVREKISEFIAQEVERDPAFQDKAKELLKRYEADGLVTEKQAEQVNGLVAAAVAQKAAQQEQSGATVESAATPGAGNAGKPDQSTSQEVPASAPTEAVSATSGAAGKAEQGAEQLSQETPQAPSKIEPTAPPAGADFGKEARALLDTVTEPGKKPDINLVASALYAAEDLRHFTVAALDNRTGDAPTKTLEKLDALVQASLKGEHGQEAQEVAQDTKTLVERWKLEDAERVAQEGGAKPAQGEPEKASEAAQPTSPAPAASEAGTAPASEKDAAASNPPVDAASGTQKDASASTAPTADKQQDARAEAAPQEQQVAPPKEAASAAALGAEPAAPAAQDTAQQSAVAADKPAAVEPPAFDPDREAKQQRFAETEIAAGKLAMLMDNPAGSFTNRDKSWNEGKIQEAANLVMRLDPDSVSQMSAKQRGAVMEYGSWLAMNAHSEKLPGFDSPDGKAKAEAMANHVAQIIGKFEGPTEVSAGVSKSLEKAERMVAEKSRMSMEAERSGVSMPEASGSAPTKRQAAESFAKDLVHMVYQKSELTEADVKYAMKGASQLTPQTMKQLSPELKAQATTALEFLTKVARDGDVLKDFSSLPPAVKKNVIGAQQTVNTLNAEFSRDPKVTTEMIKATEALPVLEVAGSSAESSKTTAKGLDQSGKNLGASPDQTQGKAAGRELDR